MKRLTLAATAMAVPKSPTEPSEDAWAFDPVPGRVAVSDGASRAIGSGAWARCLVSRFVAAPPEEFDAPSLCGWATRAAEEWVASLRVPEDAPPYVQDAAARGSFATFLGIVVDPGPSGTGSVWWRAVAIGDTCLVALRDDTVVTCFPLDRPDLFTSAPCLLPTSPGRIADSVADAVTAHGACGAGDVLLVMTDALARWALERSAHGGEVWRFLSRVAPQGFEKKVHSLWVRGELDSDDITLVRCRAESGR
ncbi:hypothetical protein ACFQ7F_04215 [Streptomyces sp. NPDC056486]|uniref:hypothetical protein n=1 Tax=Streptomyces sp. NPDC056486 TaxID=3345835 RepID=UPI00369BE9C7